MAWHLLQVLLTWWVIDIWLPCLLAHYRVAQMVAEKVLFASNWDIPLVNQFGSRTATVGAHQPAECFNNTFSVTILATL